MNANIYIAGKGFLYKMDPRAKVIVTLLSCIFVFLPVIFYSVICFSLVLIALTLFSIGIKDTRRIFNSILPMLIIMLIFSPLYVREGIALWTYNDTVILTIEGLKQSLLLDFRFLSITFACSLLFTTTKMENFILALQDFKVPYKACLTISLVFRTIPSIFDAFGQISDSHKLRRAGNEDEKKTLKSRISNLFPTLTSALVVSLRSIPTLAMSLEARGYGLKRKRTSFHDLKNHKHPFLESIAYIILFVVLFFVLRIR